MNGISALDLLTRDPLSPAAEAIRQSFETLGVPVHLIFPERELLTIGSETPTSPTYAKRPGTLLVNRILGNERSLNHVLTMCEIIEKDYPDDLVVNSTKSVRVALSKREQTVLYAAEGLPIPKTILIGAGVSPDQLIDLLGLPIVVKPDVGFGGRGLSLCRSYQEVTECVLGLGSGGGVAQRFIPEGYRTLRVLTVKGEVLGCAMRVAKKLSWLGNVLQGASVEKFHLSTDLVKLALEATACVGLTIAGVDIVLTASGPLLLESNQSPGIVGVQSISTVDIADSLARKLLS